MTTGGLLSAQELAAVRETAESGMITPVTIQRHSLIENDYGSQEVYTTVATVLGWLTEMTATGAVIGEIGGVQAIPSVYRLFVPVGTDIQGDDKIIVGGNAYIVQHTDEGGTYLPMLTAIMRRAE